MSDRPTDRRLAIGLDLGGTRLRAALVDEHGTVLERTEVPTAASSGPDVVIGQMDAAARMVAVGVGWDRLVGVGMSAPGPLDAVNGKALCAPTLAGFVDMPIARMLQDRIGLPVRLENDGIAAALGEWRFGAARGKQHFVYATISTGIGGGVVVDGHLLRGRLGMAGHVGHMTIVKDGEACACGNKGCWEAYASGTAFNRRARQRAAQQPMSLLGKNGAAVDGGAVFAAAEKGDALARDLVAEEADFLGIGVAGLLHLYSPELVVLGGGVANGFDMLHDGIVARVRQAAMPPFRDVPVVRAALGDNSGLVGAALLAFENADDAKSLDLSSGR